MENVVYSQMSSSEKERLHSFCGEILHRLDSANGLDDLLNIHRAAWNGGIRNANIGPNEYGMFRCSDISKMDGHQVFLGNVNGLFTNSLSRWSAWHESGDLPDNDYSVLVEQYRSILRSNVNSIRCSLFDSGIDRDRLSKVLCDLASRKGAAVSDIRIESPALSSGDLHTFSFRGSAGNRLTSSLLLMESGFGKVDVFVPEGWSEGLQVKNKRSVGDCPWRSLSDGHLYDLRPTLLNKLGLDRDLSKSARMKL